MNHPAADAPPSRFNVSRWALEHPALTRYLMVVMLVLGFAAYFQLGQDEDPPFTFRAMVVQAFWPGATAEQMAEQVTDKIERALQEVPHADIIRSYTKPGESLTFLQLADSSPPKDVAASWYQARKKVGDMRGTLPQGVIGPVFNDDFGDVYGSIFALSADGFSREELRRHAERVRQRLLKVPDVAKVELFGAQPEKIFVEISQKRLAQLGLDMGQVVAQLEHAQADHLVGHAGRKHDLRVHFAVGQVGQGVGRLAQAVGAAVPKLAFNVLVLDLDFALGRDAHNRFILKLAAVGRLRHGRVMETRPGDAEADEKARRRLAVDVRGPAAAVLEVAAGARARVKHRSQPIAGRGRCGRNHPILIKKRIADKEEQLVHPFQAGGRLAEGVGRGVEDGRLAAGEGRIEGRLGRGGSDYHRSGRRRWAGQSGTALAGQQRKA